MKDTIKYAGMFELRLEACSGKALCVDSDELQALSDALANAGHAGLEMDVRHRMDLYDAPNQQQRLAANQAWLEATLASLAAQEASHE